MRTSVWIHLILAIGLTLSATGQAAQSLATGESLNAGQFLVSANGRYFAILQTDGNFCVYRGSGPADNHGPLWCSAKTAAGGKFRAVMQNDGNFVVYPEGSSSALWATMSGAGGGQFVAIMQDDGNFVIYPGTNPSASTAVRALWNSGTAQGGRPRHPFDIPFPSPQAPYTWPNEGGQLIECTASPFERIDLGEVGPMHIYAGDGCSMPSNDGISEVYKDVFSQACKLHDICYLGPGNSKAFCDDMFRWHMDHDCERAYTNDLGRAPCHVAAAAWRVGLETPLSTEYFTRSQNWGRRNCSLK